MNVACPHCHVEMPIPDEVLRRGVARVSCVHCSFAFVIRLGDPGASRTASEQPATAPPIEGLKSSGSASSAAGEIGDQERKFIRSDTLTRVVIDPEIAEAIKESGAPLLIAPRAASRFDPTEPEALAACETVTDPMPLPVGDILGAPIETFDIAGPSTPPPSAPPPSAPSASFTPGPRTESGDRFEAFRPVGAPAPPPPGAEPVSPPAPSAPPRPFTPPGAPITFASPAASVATGAAAQAPFTPPGAPISFSSPVAAVAPGAFSPPGAPILSSPFARAGAVTPAGFTSPGAPRVTPTPPLGMPIVPAAAPPMTVSTVAPPVAAVPIALAPMGPAMPLGYSPPIAPPMPAVFYPGAAVMPPGQPVPSELGQELSPSPPRPGRGVKVIGVFMMLVLGLATLFFLFVLYRNDWSVDPANLGLMVDRAFGRAEAESPREELRGLEVSSTIVEAATLGSGEQALIVRGLVRNNDTRSRRYISVRARLLDNHERPVGSAEAPAGNSFTREDLQGWSKKTLEARFNPAGRDGNNRRVKPGQSLEYMVVIIGVPPGYSPQRYQVIAEVCAAEVLTEP